MASSTDEWTSWLPWIQFAQQYLESQKKGNFVQPPMSPEQQMAFNWALSYLKATPSSSAMLMPILQYDLSHPASIDVGALKAGNVGFTPAQHMSPEQLAAVFKGAGAGAVPPPSGTPPPLGTTGGATNNPISGDAFGHMGALAGSQNDPFANLPSGSGGDGEQYRNNFDSPTWNAIVNYAKTYGKSVAEIALGLMSGNFVMTGKGIVDAYHANQQSTQPFPPLSHNDVSAGNLAPAGGGGTNYGTAFDEAYRQGSRRQLSIDGHPIYQTTPSQLAGQIGLSQQMNDMRGNGTGTPEGQGIGQPGFGYGLDYNKFYNGGGSGYGGGGDASFGQLVRRPGKLV